MPWRLAFLLLACACAGCTQGAGRAFSQAEKPSPVPTVRAQLDVSSLDRLRDQLAAALLRHLNGGSLDVGWGGGVPATVGGPYSDSPPEADAAALEALHSLASRPAPGVTVPPGLAAQVASAETDAFKQLDGPRGGAYLLLADAAHPPPASAPVPVDPTPTACPTPGAGQGNPGCLRRQVSDGLLAAWYANDTKMFFHPGDASTVYRPVDAIAVGSALTFAGFQQHDEGKIQAGEAIIQKEMKTDLDSHYGLLYGLITATASGGHTPTDYTTHVADQAGAADAVLDAFDASREQSQMASSQALLEPLLSEPVSLRAPSGGYVTGFDLQSSGPPDKAAGDVVATVLALQAAHHYDRDDGGRYVHLEETAAAALLTVVDADRRQGGDPADGLPAAVPATGFARRSGLTTALAVVVLGDVLQDLAGPSPTPAG